MQPENANDPFTQPNTQPEVQGPEPTPAVEPNSFATPPEVSPTPPQATPVVSAATFQPAEPVVAPTPAPEAPAAVSSPAIPSSTGEPVANVSDLTLYLVVLFSGLSTIASASYMAWVVLTYFLTKPSAFSLFDFSTFNIYVLLYLVLFGVLNVLASLRLEKRVKEQGVIGSSLSTVGAIWRALLVVWGVSAVVGILYAPLSATIADDGEIASSITIDIVTALFALTLIGGFFWRDMLVHKLRSALIPTAVVAVLVAFAASVGAYATLNPKKPSFDSNSMYNSSSSFEYDSSDASESSSSFDMSTDEDSFAN